MPNFLLIMQIQDAELFFFSPPLRTQYRFHPLLCPNTCSLLAFLYWFRFPTCHLQKENVRVHRFGPLFSNKTKISGFLLFFFVISLPWHCISTDVWLHAFNTEGPWRAERIFCHFHVSSAGNRSLPLELWCCPLFQNKTKKGFFFIDTETYLAVELCVRSTCYHRYCYTPTKNRRLHRRIRKCVRNARILFFFGLFFFPAQSV